MKYLNNGDLLSLLIEHVRFVEDNNIDVDIELCIRIIKELDYDEDAIKAIYAFKEELGNAKDEKAANRIYDDLLEFWRTEIGYYDHYKEY
ncbi:hypothetical protein [Apilactobacillus kunkeei]|uniref:hypothetical protein n=1 Tax=Apilactobacillus kunkeei TaxID=148814 RepID=UPI0030E98547